MLNDYSDAVISSIEEAGGEVLKLMGDGTLAIFRGDVASRTCAAALDARALLDKRLVALNAQRSAEGRPVTDVYLGLHVGDVFYGNIGSQDRLDSTVIGPAVNEVSALRRFANLCNASSSGPRPLRQSCHVRRAMVCNRSVSHVLRGVSRAQELFTMTIENAPPEIGMTSAEPGAVLAKAC